MQGDLTVPYDLAERLAKRDGAQFSYSDLNSFAQMQVLVGSPVVVLTPNKWVKLANQWFLCKQVSGNIDDAYARLITRPCRPLLDWVLLPIAKFKDAGTWVIWGAKILSTNIVLDVWYVGDGSEGVALAAIGI